MWREFDATKNSVSMFAREYFSHKELHGKNRKDMIDMTFEKVADWNKCPAFFKRGTYFQKIENPKVNLTTGEVVYRREIIKVQIPPLVKISNRVDFLWFGHSPKISE
jgi:hypothetical protein